MVPGTIALYFAAMAVTAGIFLWAHRLSRLHPRIEARIYFYYLLASGSLALLGKPLPVLISGWMRLGDVQADRFFSLFDLLAAKPLWFLSIFLLIKCVAAFVEKAMSRAFVAAYGMVGIGYLAAAAIFLLGFFRTGVVSAGARTMNAVFLYIEAFVALGIWAWGIHRSARLARGPRRAGAREFCWIGFVSRAVFWLLILIQFSFTVPFLVGVALPIPALIFLTGFWKRADRGAAAESGDQDGLDALSERCGITPREREIIAWVCAGRSNKAISAALFISIHTVKRHINQIYGKIGVENRVQLANAVRAAAPRPAAGNRTTGEPV